MRMLAGLVVLVLLMTGVSAEATPHAAPRPIVFVHGFFGSGSQFETQAKRFAVNGYSPSHIESHEYDSTFITNTREQVYASLDTRIALPPRASAPR